MKILYRSIFLLSISILLWNCSENPEIPMAGELPAMDLFDQSYGNETNQLFDIFLPQGRSRENTPLIIYIHGGGWIDGSKEEFLQFRQSFQREFPDYAIASINYRLFDFLTGKNKFPTQENDVIAAVRSIQLQTVNWNISDQIILAGASAGGHLALLHSYKHQTIGNIKAVIAFFPPSDLVSLYTFNQITQLGLNALLGGNPQEQATAYLESSPSNFIQEAVVPTIFFHGSSDTVVPVWQSDLFADKLNSVSARFEYKRIENQGHGFNDPTYSQAFKDAASFLERNLE
ncbi:MAG: alpha/beta hydrolase [Algoriphagus sp.]|jgi:acetyl esterase/lipase|uniref:alpha/beta hydrolase n=1 Tax=Algoriphagus sp. TaxID=1872435 RepID=UPI00262D69FB|nr:alpha/beta hydrolase [Algoriphagus sp.]MDG1275867.1 alpha/beta hydrolase [Algoriphagus sp.]